jgi:hypothetical protein
MRTALISVYCHRLKAKINIIIHNKLCIFNQNYENQNS